MRRLRTLRTAREVVKALGGADAVMRLFETETEVKITRQQLWNWESYFYAFPPKTYWIMTRELTKQHCFAPASLWKMLGAGGNKRAA